MKFNMDKMKEFVDELGRVPETLIDMRYCSVNPRGHYCHGVMLGIVARNKGLYDFSVDHTFPCYIDILVEFLSDGKFLRVTDLTEWAKNNPDIWGNAYGGRMFYDEQAIGQTTRKSYSSKLVHEHWKGVYERLMESRSGLRRGIDLVKEAERIAASAFSRWLTPQD